ncbi:Lar family restriction alleviation protein [Enterobacter kobei]|uniref:Lar family restriction alleviation protein n=1 Tax=Enterobacter kobei TaxID=208224 RepID=UPI003D6835F4
MSELNTCPFCGGRAEALTTAGTEFGTYWHFAECMMCDTKSGLYESEANLIEAWNRRAGDEADNLPSK